MWFLSWFNRKVVADSNRAYVSLLHHRSDFSVTVGFQGHATSRKAKQHFCLNLCSACSWLTTEKNLKHQESTGVRPQAQLWTHHGRQGGVQAGFSLAVVCIAVLVTAAVIDKADLQVHPTLQAGQKQTGHQVHLAFVTWPHSTELPGFANKKQLYVFFMWRSDWPILLLTQKW